MTTPTQETASRQPVFVALASFVAVLALQGLAPEAAAEDWTQWMGPRRNGAVAAPGVFADGEPVRLRLAWRRPLAEGFSSVTVADGRAYTLATSDEEDLLVAFDTSDGAELWRYRLDEAGIEKSSSTPAVGGGRVFALNARGKLHAVSAAHGSAVWSVDLKQRLGAVPLSYGMSTSPLLVDGLVVVLVGGKEGHNLVAFDQKTGVIAWSVSHAQRGSYASPALLTIGGERQIVTPADDRLYSVRPGDGSLIWSHEGLGYLDRIPLLLSGDRLFFAQESGAVMLRVLASDSGWRTKEIWRTRELKDSYSPAIHHEGLLFGFNGSFLTCLDATTGERRWNHQVGNGSLILVDRHLLVLDAFSGRLSVVPARSDKFVERASLGVVTITEGAGSYASPSFAGGRVFVRGGEEIAAVEIAR